MPFAPASGARLYYEETGSGTPVLFIHEFGGDYRTWEPQVRYFSRRYRCIVYNARGYPPSDVPQTVDAYGQKQAVDDAVAVLDHLGIERAHICGLSMGGYATLHFGIRFPKRALSLAICGAGHGSDPSTRESFLKDAAELAERLEKLGMAEGIANYALSPTRLPFRYKDPRGFEEFRTQFGEHSNIGSALTMRGYQLKRPTVYELESQMREIDVPTLIITGDEDSPCLEPGLFMKRNIPTAGLLVVPNSGHCINLEEIDAFNRALLEFWTAAESKTWRTWGNKKS
ncbi:MAG TPA: alpha/beta fold hydrolase [Burkholderiales bacterium]|nr:alpha/beta fold hydrolase [Burkholderiales bacterium]